MRTVGRYRILERLASGGMADVYRAEVVGAEGVRKEVALKLVRSEHAGSSEFVARFVREARLAVRLSHANVVQIFEFDQADGRHFIAMELVRGHHLGRVIERCREQGTRFGVARAIFVAAEVANALAYAHQPGEDGSPGLVHRDVSPHNLLLSWEGEVKLADFGIARLAAGGLTVPGTLEGKLAWVAPEQARGEPADGRADLFSLGVVLWELLTGRRLFARDSEAATLEALLRGPVPSPPSSWNEEIPPELDALVLRCLERDPADRIASARELGDRLRELLLQVARSPLDWELRSLMRRLWPEGPAAQVGGGEETVRRPPPAAPVAPIVAEPIEEEPRTLAAARAPGRLGRPALAGLAILAGAVAGWSWLGAGAPATVPAAPRGEAAPAGGREEGSPLPDAERAAGPSAPEPGETVEGGVADAGGVPPAAIAAPAPLAPGAAAGEGLLAVNVLPWATLSVDGRRVGDTPRELRLPAGLHRLRAEHPRLGAAEATVEIVPGRRAVWHPRLTR